MLVVTYHVAVAVVLRVVAVVEWRPVLVPQLIHVSLHFERDAAVQRLAAVTLLRSLCIQKVLVSFLIISLRLPKL